MMRNWLPQTELLVVTCYTSTEAAEVIQAFGRQVRIAGVTNFNSTDEMPPDSTNLYVVVITPEERTTEKPVIWRSPFVYEIHGIHDLFTPDGTPYTPEEIDDMM